MSEPGYQDSDMKIDPVLDLSEFDPSVAQFTGLAFSMSGCDACAYMREAIENLDSAVFNACRFFSFFVTPNGPSSEALSAYNLREFPTLVWFERGVELKRWAGFFADPDPRAREAQFSAIIMPLVVR